MMPLGVLHASPVSETPPHKSHRELLHGGLVDNRFPLGIQPRAQQTREGLEIKCNGDGNKPGKTVSISVGRGLSIARAELLGRRQRRERKSLLAPLEETVYRNTS